MAKVIIVEDDPMVATINKKYAEKVEGMTVLKIFHDGEEALMYLEKEKVNVIIMDLYMPKLSGLELLSEIRKRKYDCDVIMVTAANDLSSIQEALHLGILDYLVKPFTFDRFKAALEKYNKKNKVMSKGEELSQGDIDKLISLQPNGKETIDSYEKGINNRTLEEIITHLQNAKPNSLTSEELSHISGFSMVTVRRYMNYLIEKDFADSFIDYRTGGRPSVHYFVKEK